MDVIEQLDVILPDLGSIARRIPIDEYDRPTPCDEFRVRDLFDHMIGGASQFAPQLRGNGSPVAVDPSTLDDAERQAALDEALEQLAAAVRTAGALGRTVTLPFGAVPGSVLAKFLTLDGMVHTWDLATATGRSYEPPEDLVESVLASAHELIGPDMRDGETFAAEVPVSDDATPIARLVAFTGRTPA